MIKRVLTWAVAIFVIYFLATQPTASAGIVHSWYNVVRDVGISLSRFVTQL